MRSGLLLVWLRGEALAAAWLPLLAWRMTGPQARRAMPPSLDARLLLLLPRFLVLGALVILAFVAVLEPSWLKVYLLLLLTLPQPSWLKCMMPFLSFLLAGASPPGL